MDTTRLIFVHGNCFHLANGVLISSVLAIPGLDDDFYDVTGNQDPLESNEAQLNLSECEHLTVQGIWRIHYQFLLFKSILRFKLWVKQKNAFHEVSFMNMAPVIVDYYYSPICSIVNLVAARSVLFFDMAVIIWVYRCFLAWLPERQLWGTLGICINPRWPLWTLGSPPDVISFNWFTYNHVWHLFTR